MDPDTLLLTICGPLTGRVPVLDSPCVVGVFHSHAVGLRGAPYQTQQPGLMARNHSPCTVLSAHTRQTTACSVSTRIAQRRVELAAARPLPSPVSPASLKASPCIPRESHALRPQALYMRWHPTPVLGHTNRGLSCTEIPPRTMCGSGLSPDPADSLSHRLAYVRRSCRRNFRRSVAVAGAQKRSLGENHGTVLDVFPPNAVSLLPEPLLEK